MRKVESLKELNKIVQKPNYKKIGNWMARYLVRDIALPLTWLFLHTSISANGVTLISLIVGLIGCAIFAFGTRWAFLLGVCFLQLWYLLDHVDGQIARYRKQETITGIFFDYISHHLIHMGVFMGISWGVFAYKANILYIFLGILSAISALVLNLIYDSQYKAFFHFAEKNKYIVFFSTIGQSQPHSKFKATFSWMHKLCEIHVLMNMLTVLAIWQFLSKVYWWDKIIIFYSVLITLVAVTKLSYFILKNKPDENFYKRINLTSRNEEKYTV